MGTRRDRALAGAGLAELAAEAGGGLLGGEQSLKVALECDWDDPTERVAAPGKVVAALDTVETWLGQREAVPGEAHSAVAIAETVRDQDVGSRPEQGVQLQQGVAKDRRISVEDGPATRGPQECL